jgi:hypothetical protein
MLIALQEEPEVALALIVAAVIGAPDGRLKCAVHPLDLPIGPRAARNRHDRQPRLRAMRLSAAARGVRAQISVTDGPWLDAGIARE